MQTLERLSAGDLAAVVRAYRDALRSHQEAINRLNVFPVPDGDTGTNMALTLESVVEELGRREGSSMDSVAEAISYGSLMGARGNSGVILSQILRGLAEVARGTENVDSGILAEGFRRAADGAYGAVQRPVEGTILTVARAAAEACSELPPGAGNGSGRLLALLEAARVGAAEALERTPDLLPVLKTAGVVDSGGAGFVLLLDAFLHVADGRPLPEAADVGSPRDGAAPVDVLTGHEPGSPVLGGPRYEVMYLLEAADELVPAFRDVWEGFGDSIVVVGGGGIWNCHIHTDDIGASIEAGVGAGRPRQIRVTDLWEQVEEERWVRDAATTGGGEGVEEQVHCAVVVVCSGGGIRRIFRSLGVRHFVEGGQSMNPSTAELLDAIDKARCDEAVILPNNKNIVPVAEQAALRASKPVRVIPTRGIQEGFAALLEYDPGGDADANVLLMSESARHIVAGEVTRAIRSSSCDAGPIAEGDYLGLSRDTIEVVDPSLSGAAIGLLDHLVDADHHEIVTLIAGEGSTPADTRRITEWLAERHPGMTAEVHPGGQPLYPYLFSIE